MLLDKAFSVETLFSLDISCCVTTTQLRKLKEIAW